MEPKMVHSRKDSYIERDEDVTRAIKATKSFKKITDPVKVKAFYDKLMKVMMIGANLNLPLGTLIAVL